MAIYSNENILKIVKLRPRKFPHLVQNHENSIYSIPYTLSWEAEGQ